MVKWLKYIGAGFAGLILVAVLGLMVAQQVSDGPMSFIQGGSFKTGEVVEEPVTDWSFGLNRSTEFELVGYGTSRTAGYIMLDGVPYMTCDLGFIWNRLDGGIFRYTLNLIYIFKDWHHDAVADGRALLRIDDKIYKAQFTKVEEPALQAALENHLEGIAEDGIGVDLGPVPEDGPNDIWFFRIDSRS